MSFVVYLKQAIEGHTDFPVVTLDITDGLLKKGKYRIPVMDISYIKEI